MSAFNGGILARAVDSTSSGVEFFELAFRDRDTQNIAVVSGNCCPATALMQQLLARK
jgi:hypothetical protein